jgi:hypothetical protein
VKPVDTNRRRLLAIAGIAPLMFAWRNPAFAADQIACHDPATLPLAQKRQRRAIGYVEPSADPRKASGCGSCQFLSGGPVVATALCSSFAPKAGI